MESHASVHWTPVLMLLFSTLFVTLAAGAVAVHFSCRRNLVTALRAE